ncbi:MAG: hypothetical protein DLM73_12900 [Chthoniobacterales bacterium]|nr:MAG: hypothetical protein DLM73_12900 [Chthoniobacterales bacterium]
MSHGLSISPGSLFTARLLELTRTRRKTLLVLICLVALVPMIRLSYLVRHYGVEVPTLDDWEMAPLIVQAHTGQLRWADIFAQQEEARTVLPKLIFVLSAAGGHWDVRDQMMLSVVCSWLTAAGIFFLLRRSQLNLAAFALCFWLAVLTISSTAQFELWIFASGFPSFLPGFFLVAALVTIATNLSTLWKFVICAALATASSFSLPHGLLAWGLTFPVLLISRRVSRWPSWLTAWLVVSGICVVAYFWGYQKPAYLPAFAPAASLREYALFILEFLGGGLAYSLKDQPAVSATVFGALQLALFSAALIYSAGRIRNRAFLARVAPWFALGLQTIGSAMLAALGRIGFGASYALASRYVTFSLLLTIAVIALVAIVAGELARADRSRWSRACVLAICAILIIGYLEPYKVAAANTRFFLRSLSAKDRLAHGAVLFRVAIDTSEVIKKTAYPDDGRLVQYAEALDRQKLLRPPLVRTNHLNPLPHEAADGKNASGSCDTLAPVDAQLIRATGWAVLNRKGRPADCVAVAYQLPAEPEWILFTISESFEMRPPIVKRFRNMDQLWSGWTATFPKSAIPAGAKLSFWAVDADEPKLYRLEDKTSP